MAERKQKCDMIKRNESDVRDVVNQISNCNGVCFKMKHFEVVRKFCKKIEIEIFDK